MPKQDRWHVKVALAVVEMTIDELVDAFQSGQIDASTLVIAPGEGQWTTLGAVADLGEAEPCPPSIAPMATDIDVDMMGVDGYHDTLAVDGIHSAPTKKKRRVGRAIGVVLAYATLIAIGAGAGAYRAAPGEVRAKATAIQTRILERGGAHTQPAVAAQPPAAVATATPTPTPTPPPPPAQPTPTPTAQPQTPAAQPQTQISAASPTPSQVGTSIDSLPTAKPSAKQAAPPPPPRRRTQRR